MVRKGGIQAQSLVLTVLTINLIMMRNQLEKLAIKRKSSRILLQYFSNFFPPLYDRMCLLQFKAVLLNCSKNYHWIRDMTQQVNNDGQTFIIILFMNLNNFFNKNVFNLLF